MSRCCECVLLSLVYGVLAKDLMRALRSWIRSFDGVLSPAAIPASGARPGLDESVPALDLWIPAF
jgi:hypothetical protein